MMQFFAICFILSAREGFSQEPAFFLKNGQKILFLGDSNTFAGEYITNIDGYLFTRFPDQIFELINLGLSSETISGCSEADHPFPRPNVQNRLTKALEKIKPDIVFLCYGMNDGIYSPFDENRFKAYQEGTKKALKLIRSARAIPILLTPPPFDPVPIKKRTLGENQKNHSYKSPYVRYDEEVLQKYSDWLLTLKSNTQMVIDLHGPMKEYIESQRLQNPNYRLSGDGIHFNSIGHLIICKEILHALHAPALVDLGEFGTMKPMENIREYTDKNGLYRFRWKTKLPMPINPKITNEQIESIQLYGKLDALMLRGQFIQSEQYRFYMNGKEISKISGEELSGGANLTRISKMPFNEQSKQLWPVIQKRRQLIGTAWLSEVGSDHPNTPKGKPLQEAIIEAKKLREEILEKTQPQEYLIELKPINK